MSDDMKLFLGMLAVLYPIFLCGYFLVQSLFTPGERARLREMREERRNPELRAERMRRIVAEVNPKLYAEMERGRSAD